MLKGKVELCAQIPDLEPTKRRMILEMKTRPSEDDEPKSGECGSVSGSRAKTAFGGGAEKAGKKGRCWWEWITNIVQVLVLKISKYKNYYVNNAHAQINVPSLHIAPVCSGNRMISSAHREQVLTRETFYGRIELGIHTKTTAAGRNCVSI